MLKKRQRFLSWKNRARTNFKNGTIDIRTNSPRQSSKIGKFLLCPCSELGPLSYLTKLINCYVSLFPNLTNLHTLYFSSFSVKGVGYVSYHYLSDSIWHFCFQCFSFNNLVPHLLTHFVHFQERWKGVDFRTRHRSWWPRLGEDNSPVWFQPQDITKHEGHLKDALNLTGSETFTTGSCRTADFIVIFNEIVHRISAIGMVFTFIYVPLIPAITKFKYGNELLHLKLSEPSVVPLYLHTHDTNVSMIIKPTFLSFYSK